MKLFKHGHYNKNNDDKLKAKAIEIVDKLTHRWPWEEPHTYSIKYVLEILKTI